MLAQVHSGVSPEIAMKVIFLFTMRSLLKTSVFKAAQFAIRGKLPAERFLHRATLWKVASQWEYSFTG